MALASRVSRLVVVGTAAATLSALAAVPAVAGGPRAGGGSPSGAAGVVAPGGLRSHSGFATSATTPTGDEKGPKASASPVAAAVAKAKASGEAQPIPGKTTAMSAFTANPDGTVTMEQAAGPVRVRRDGG
jgi:hypothetical protein